MNKKVLVIGAGIHGIHIALEFSKKGNDVTIIDANRDMLLGTSFATHNRIHLGYHYPRSKETAKECIEGYYYFVKNYKDCLLFPDFYYVVEKYNSNLSAEQYKSTMHDYGLECESNWPEPIFLNREMIEDSFKVKEACFDIWKLKKIFKEKFKEFGVTEIYGFEIKNAHPLGDNRIKLSSGSSEIEIKSDLIINCTYTYTNNLQKAFSILEDLTPYKFEDTEIAVVESNMKIPALTVMDGPFITILPYFGKENHYLVYDKVNSVIRQEIGVEYKPVENFKTNWDKMLEHGLKYYPFFKDLKYKYSIYGNRPISLKSKSDGRSTKIIKHKYPIEFYSILEGKFVSAPLIAEKFVEAIEKEICKGKKALIGHTGFIGSNLKNYFPFDDFYNSKNIKDIGGKSYDLIISCGNSSARWMVNKNPQEDLDNILQFIEHIKKVNTKKFVLISTIDVYENPCNVYENSETGNLEKNQYGKNRLYLENFVRNNFNDCLIIRLPIVYGHNFKKNLIYDALNKKNLDQINTEAQVQIYHVKNLMKDINLAIKNNIKVLNIATEPIIVKELYQEVFNLILDNSPDKEFKYDMKTNYAEMFGGRNGYIYNKFEILNELKQFKKEYELKCIEYSME